MAASEKQHAFAHATHFSLAICLCMPHMYELAAQRCCVHAMQVTTVANICPTRIALIKQKVAKTSYT